eukprot:TRINITY_DN1278_c3_g1_i1.p2 TRINITY_DN1278_c3_g1~~TRINITY_DN1278_c3_g1_i1.p2  ORF type:complete len:230 (+),score=76.41 TRINITY_DN1278_c3_g1_i1:74-691(+)
MRAMRPAAGCGRRVAVAQRRGATLRQRLSDDAVPTARAPQGAPHSPPDGSAAGAQQLAPAPNGLGDTGIRLADIPTVPPPQGAAPRGAAQGGAAPLSPEAQDAAAGEAIAQMTEEEVRENLEILKSTAARGARAAAVVAVGMAALIFAYRHKRRQAAEAAALAQAQQGDEEQAAVLGELSAALTGAMREQAQQQQPRGQAKQPGE